MPNQTQRSAPISDAELSKLGAEILGNYNHPDSWTHGRAQSTAPMFATSMVLRVNEAALNGTTYLSDEQSRLNGHAIRVFIATLGLNPFDIYLDQRPGFAPYLVVPRSRWNHVLPILRANL